MIDFHTLSDAQQRALKWLHGQGGSGVVNKHGKLLAAGVVAHFDNSTWVRLISQGLVAGGDYRIFVTDAGRACLPINDR